MLVTTGFSVPGAEIEQILGVVRGVVVRSSSSGIKIKQTFFGGMQIEETGDDESFAATCDADRQKAYDLMVANADKLGAEAIIGMRFDTAPFGQKRAEILAYGTAVKLRR